jgi:uncharacterized delta-60 repeat protein
MKMKCVAYRFAAVALLGVVLNAMQSPAAEPAVAIELDPTFGKAGRVASLWDPKGPVGALGRFLVVDDKNRPIIVGNTPKQRFAISRFTTEGEFDTTFAGTGRTSICIEDSAVVEAAGNAEIQFTHGAAIDSKGRIILIGKGAGSDPGRKWDFALLRYLPSGQLDKSFSKVGYQKFQAHDARNIGLAVAIAPDCSTLVAAGYAHIDDTNKADPLLIRFQESGDVDEAFSANANGSLRWLIKEGTSASATCLAMDAQGRYLVGMNPDTNGRPSWAVARLKSSGEIDESFGERGLWTAKLNGASFAEQIFSVSVDPAGRIVLGGLSYNAEGIRCFAVARLTERGEYDTTFGTEDAGCVILSDYGANVAHNYGPRATVSKDRIAICGCVTGPNNKGTCFGVAVLDESGKHIAKVEPQPFAGSNGTDQPWGIAFDRENRLLVGGGSTTNGNRWRLAVARYLVK